jgi:hypothetical protein
LGSANSTQSRAKPGFISDIVAEPTGLLRNTHIRRNAFDTLTS